MARLECSRGWGQVYDPVSDRDVSIGEDIDADVAERLADRFDPLTVLETEDDSEEFTCGVNGCSRSVDGPEAACWQH